MNKVALTPIALSPFVLATLGRTIAVLLVLLGSEVAVAQSPKPTPPPILRLVCPGDVEPLARVLVRDLPSYLNRGYTRTVRRSLQSSESYSAIVASQPEFEPLPTGSAEAPDPTDPALYQVFFTVLERQYSQRRVTEFQHYHWLFLSKTVGGWRLALLFSRLGSFPTDRQKPLSPPRESSQGLTGQAIRSWLQDCQAGAIRR